MEKGKPITEILGLHDKEIQAYLKSHPKEAERLAKILISLEKERVKREGLTNEVKSLGSWVTSRGLAGFPDSGGVPVQQDFSFGKRLVAVVVLAILTLILVTIIYFNY